MQNRPASFANRQSRLLLPTLGALAACLGLAGATAAAAAGPVGDHDTVHVYSAAAAARPGAPDAAAHGPLVAVEAAAPTAPIALDAATAAGPLVALAHETMPHNGSTGLTMVGPDGASWNANTHVATLSVTSIQNTRSSGTSGTLRLELWASSTVPVYPNTVTFYKLGTSSNLGTLSAGHEFNNISYTNITYTAPPAGCYYVTVALEEFNGTGWPYVDLRTFDINGFPTTAAYDHYSFGGASCSLASCSETATSACLNGGQFLVTVAYNNTSAAAPGQVLYFGSTRAESSESVFFYFTDPSNFEMGVKVLNACALNNFYWVFIGGLTDQGWNVNVQDMVSGNRVFYSNDEGNLTATVADTAALPCS